MHVIAINHAKIERPRATFNFLVDFSIKKSISNKYIIKYLDNVKKIKAVSHFTIFNIIIIKNVIN